MAEAGKGPGEERIAELRRTWQESPSPRVGLQLAEEYRRAGRHADAKEVLERSLESHPGHLSSLVALGKTQLDLDQPDAAAGRFETVLERDPTHLVAGKLLIEAHLRRGDAAGARHRLEHYRLLNAGDPELDALQRRIDDLAAAAPPERGAGEAAAAEEAAAGETAAGEAVAGGEAVVAGDAAAGAAMEVAEPAGAAAAGSASASEGSAAAAVDAGAAVEPQPPALRAPAATPRAPVEHGAADPFGALAGTADERRWLAGLGASGIFPVDLPPEPEPPAAAEEPEPPVAAEEAAPPAEPEEAAVATGREAEEPARAEPIAAAGEAAAEPAAASGQPGPQAPPAAAESLAAAGREAEEPARAEPAAATGYTEPQPPAAASEPAAASWQPELQPLAAAAASAGAAAEPPVAPGDRATSTLGELYLAQGHLDDAERVFRTVLERRPEDAAATAGLAEVARRRRGPFDAAALMRWAADRGRPVTGGDRTARSAALLRAYRDRLHREGRRDVP